MAGAKKQASGDANARHMADLLRQLEGNYGKMPSGAQHAEKARNYSWTLQKHPLYIGNPTLQKRERELFEKKYGRGSWKKAP